MKNIISCLCIFFMLPDCNASEKIKQINSLTPFIGNWEVWIPGAVTYTLKDADLYREYKPGAPMNKLTIKSDASYIWGARKGVLKRVNPWYAEEGRVYYRISDKNNNFYDFWHKKESNQLIFLFGEVGGHAATGTRWGANQNAVFTPINEDNKSNSNKSSSASGNLKESANNKVDKKVTPQLKYNVGEKIEIEWSGSWYKGIVLENQGEKYKVRYDGWGELYDEWLYPNRIRKLSSK